MKIPPGKTEKEVLEAIERTVSSLAPQFVFGFYDVDDIKQQGRIYCLELLDKGKYDPARDLAAYLYRHCQRRLLNYKRDRFHRTDPPCRRCAGGDHCSPSGKCDKQVEWEKRNGAKANLMRPLDLTNAGEKSDHRSSDAETEVEIGELLERIDAELPVELRQVYLQMRAGLTVPPARRREVEDAVKAILKGDVGCDEDE
jgi:hypothetical protein